MSERPELNREPHVSAYHNETCMVCGMTVFEQVLMPGYPCKAERDYVHGREEPCEATPPEHQMAFCTRRKGHYGDHIARGTEGQTVSRWAPTIIAEVSQ